MQLGLRVPGLAAAPGGAASGCPALTSASRSYDACARARWTGHGRGRGGGLGTTGWPTGAERACGGAWWGARGASLDGLGPLGVLARLQKRGPDAPSLHRVPSGSKGPSGSQEPRGKRYVCVWAGGALRCPRLPLPLPLPHWAAPALQGLSCPMDTPGQVPVGTPGQVAVGTPGVSLPVCLSFAGGSCLFFFWT